MSKFSSFLVFTFGILLLVVLLFNLGQHFITKPPEVVEEQTDLPASDLEPFHLNTTEEFHRQLDKVFESGGIDAIRSYVSQEFVPGRKLIMRSNYPGEPDRQFLILDREVRLCNREGSALLEKAPILTRTSANLQIARKAILQTWSRTSIPVPFYLTSWCIEVR